MRSDENLRLPPGNPGIPDSQNSEVHPPIVLRTIMSAMSQQSHSDSAVVGTSDRVQHRPLRKLDVPAVNADEDPPEEWEAGRCQKGDDCIHEKSKLLLGIIFQKLWDVGHSTEGIETTKAHVTF